MVVWHLFILKIILLLATKHRKKIDKMSNVNKFVSSTEFMFSHLCHMQKNEQLSYPSKVVQNAYLIISVETLVLKSKKINICV